MQLVLLVIIRGTYAAAAAVPLGTIILCYAELDYRLHSLHNYPQQHGILHLTSYYESKRFLFCIGHPSIHPVMSRVLIKFDDTLLQYAALSLVLPLVLLLDEWSLCQLELAHNPNQLMESLVHIHSLLCTALDVRCSQLTTQLLRLLQRHPPLGIQVGFIAHHQHWVLVPILDPQDLFLEFSHFLEAGVVS